LTFDIFDRGSARLGRRRPGSDRLAKAVFRAARTPRTSRTASRVEAGNTREKGKHRNIGGGFFFSSAFSSARRSRTSRTPRTPRRRFAD
jgi:hypothetical protein